MDLLGIGGGLFWGGIAMVGGGIALAWSRLKRHGGLERTRTLHVIFDDDSPMKQPPHQGDGRLFLAGVFGAGFGLVTVFTGVTTDDIRELGVCVQACRREGYPAGQFAPSAVASAPGGGAERACWCVSPAGSHELSQQGLRPPSTPALPGSR